MTTPNPNAHSTKREADDISAEGRRTSTQQQQQQQQQEGREAKRTS